MQDFHSSGGLSRNFLKIHRHNRVIPFERRTRTVEPLPNPVLESHLEEIRMSPVSIPATAPTSRSEQTLESKLLGRSAAHHTIDEVNKDTLERLANKLGLRLEHHEPRDGPHSGPAIVLDADSWWTTAAEREQGVMDLLRGAGRPSVLVVYGWQLTDEQRENLEIAGVHVFSCPDEEVALTLAVGVASL
jgi:hypothetical protein